ncbi:MAG: hypothetical protein ACRC3H_13200 [Lachnospiraceae bacterium]
MDIKEFAKMLDGKEYGYKMFSDEELSIAAESGFVIVTGASDDLMEFEGAMRDEGSCFDGGKVYFDLSGVDQEGEKRSNCIEALWCEEDGSGEVITWTYRTDIPHETFIVYEQGDLYCRGIVFSLSDIN